MKERNFAVELLRRLIAEQVQLYQRTNTVRAEKFSEILADAMSRYLGEIGPYGTCMMRGSASLQVSIDYNSEEDAIQKLRLVDAIAPTAFSSV